MMNSNIVQWGVHIDSLYSKLVKFTSLYKLRRNLLPSMFQKKIILHLFILLSKMALNCIACNMLAAVVLDKFY